MICQDNPHTTAKLFGRCVVGVGGKSGKRRCPKKQGWAGCTVIRLSSPLTTNQCASSLAVTGSKLLKGALFRLLVRAPAEELCAVTKAAAGEMIILNFNHQLRLERLPFACLLRAPAAWSAGLVTRKSRWRSQRFELFSQLLLLRFIEARGVTHVLQ